MYQKKRIEINQRNHPDPATVKPRRCESCGEWFKPGVRARGYSCLVFHDGGCCHHNDEKVPAREVARVTVRIYFWERVRILIAFPFLFLGWGAMLPGAVIMGIGLAIQDRRIQRFRDSVSGWFFYTEGPWYLVHCDRKPGHRGRHRFTWSSDSEDARPPVAPRRDA